VVKKEKRKISDWQESQSRGIVNKRKKKRWSRRQAPWPKVRTRTKKGKLEECSVEAGSISEASWLYHQQCREPLFGQRGRRTLSPRGLYVNNWKCQL
jgi:hypothetical protein